jgi:hypothetical protein
MSPPVRSAMSLKMSTFSNEIPSSKVSEGKMLKEHPLRVQPTA